MKKMIVSFICMVTLATPVWADNFEEESDYQESPPSGRMSDKLNLHKPSINIQITTDPPPTSTRPVKKPAKRKQQAQQEEQQVAETEETPSPRGGVTRNSDGGNYAVTLNGCSVSDDRARCSLTISNNGKVRDFNLQYTHTAEDNFGNEYRTSSHGTINGKGNSKIDSAMNASGSIEFKVTPNAGSFKRLKIVVYTNGSEEFAFSGVHLTRR